MSASEQGSAHPDFDGHLERPFERLTPAERLWWLEETMRFAAAARPVVPGGMGILRGVRVRGRSPGGPEAQRPDGLGPIAAELCLTIDDRERFLAHGRRDGRPVVVAGPESHLPAGHAVRDDVLSDTPAWRDLVGRFVVLRYLTPDLSRLGVEIERDRSPLVIVAHDEGIEARRSGGR